MLTVSVEQIGEDWQINFADTGPGMSRQQMEKIFEPFQSQFEGGTGLGLAIVYQIVQAHEGKVWARSKIGEGTSSFSACAGWRGGKLLRQTAGREPDSCPRLGSSSRRGGHGRASHG